MMNVMVKWGWADDYGRVLENKVEWFENKNNAEAWILEMKEKNRGFFAVVEVKEANYERWLRMVALERELEELRKEF